MLENIFLSIDFVGCSPKFFINKNEKFKTVFGGMLSCLTGIIIAASSIYFVNLLFSRSTYSVIINEEYNPTPFRDWTNEEFSIILLDKFLDNVHDRENIYDIYADFWWNKPYMDDKGVYNYKMQRNEIKLETCNITKHFPNSIDLWRDQKLINQSYCMRRNQNFNSSLTFGANNSTGVVFWIHKCLNTTKKKNCAPQEVIDETLTNVFFLVRFKDYFFKHDSIDKVAVPFIYSDQMQASSTAYKRLFYYFRNVEYQSDNGFIFPEINTYHFTNFAGTRDATDLRSIPTVPGTFAVASFYSYTLKQIYIKKYYKVQNMMADLGGILKSFLLISYLINYYFCNKLYYQSIITSNMNNFSNTDINPKESYVTKNTDILRNTLVKSLSTGRNLDNNNNSLMSIRKKIKYLKFKEIVFPTFCFKKKSTSKNKLELHEKMKEIIYEQLDVNELICRMNSVDKLLYIMNGSKLIDKFIECSNPMYFKELNSSDINVPIYEYWVNNYKRILNIKQI